VLTLVQSLLKRLRPSGKANWNWIHSGLGCSSGRNCWGIVGQILYTSVSENLKEFGTLKAMGASDRVIYSVIVEQALWMAILGYLPGMVLCFRGELGRMQLRAS